MASSATLLDFPCDFPLKIMGKRRDGFAEAMVAIVRKYAPDFDPATVDWRVSSQGRYLALTCVIRARSQAQLDALYRELAAHPWVEVVL